MIRQTISHYRILEKLGQGGMADDSVGLSELAPEVSFGRVEGETNIILGDSSNSAPSVCCATVGGGASNTASGHAATVGGGG